MGIWSAMSSTGEGLKQYLPDPAPMKNRCSYALNTVRAASPDLSAAGAIFRRSASWINHTVRINSPIQISSAVSDPDTHNRIARTTWNLLDHALEHGTRPYTCGIPAYRILKEGLFSSERPSMAGKEMSDMRKRLERLEALETERGSEGFLRSDALRLDDRMRRRSEAGDVIQSFIVSGFRGGDFINEQVIPVVDESRRRAARDFVLCKLI